MSTRSIETVVSRRRDTISAALCTTKFCTAGMSSSSDPAKGRIISNNTVAENTIPNIFIPLRIGAPLQRAL